MCSCHYCVTRVASVTECSVASAVTKAYHTTPAAYSPAARYTSAGSGLNAYTTHLRSASAAGERVETLSAALLATMQGAGKYAECQVREYHSSQRQCHGILGWGVKAGEGQGGLPMQLVCSRCQ